MGLGLSNIGIYPKWHFCMGKWCFTIKFGASYFQTNLYVFFSFLKYFPTVKHIQLSQILSLSPGLVACLDHLNSAISICPYFTTIIWATLVTSLVSTSWSPKFIIAVLNSLLYKQPLSIGEFNTSSTFCFIDLDLIADRHLGCHIVPKSVYDQAAASATRHLTLTHHLGGSPPPQRWCWHRHHRHHRHVCKIVPVEGSNSARRLPSFSSSLKC